MLNYPQPTQVDPETLLEGQEQNLSPDFDPSVEGMEEADLPVDLEGEDLKKFTDKITAEFKRADEERQSLVMQANMDEMGYNLEPYPDYSRPFSKALSIRVPSVVAKIDKTAAELAATYDRDGSPIYRAVPQSPSQVTLASHAERTMHQIMQNSDAMRFIRLTIKRAMKVGTSYLVSEVVSQPIQSNRVVNLGMGDDFEFQNNIVIRSVKLQDMYISPFGIVDIKDAGFVGERFQLPRWKFEEYIDDGFYQEPMNPETGEPIEIVNGYFDQYHGQAQEWRRLHTSGETANRGLQSDVVDLIRAWVRYKAPGERRAKLYYVVFPIAMPHIVLRLKENPYTYLGHAPYVAMNVDEGDGTIYGRSWMTLTRDLSREQDSLHMIRLEAAKRMASNFYLVKEGSSLEDEVRRRSGEATGIDEDFSDTAPLAEDIAKIGKVARFVEDEIIATENPDMDLKSFPMASSGAQGLYQLFQEEQTLVQYMDQATVDSTPTNGIRSAFEVRIVNSQYGSKLKTLLKVINSTALLPLAENLKAQIWEYMMQPSMLSENIRFMEYGDFEHPITLTDWFSGVMFVPAGTTTSADETIAITTTASLVSEFIPLINQIPGIVPDPRKATREILKARAAALGFQNYEQIFGLADPTPEEIQKAEMYIAALQQLHQGVGPQMPQGIMGGDAGAVMGAPQVTAGGMMGAPGAAPQQSGGGDLGMDNTTASQMKGQA
jgi:hypothetical protein